MPTTQPPSQHVDPLVAPPAAPSMAPTDAHLPIWPAPMAPERRHSPAAERNQGPIAQVLARLLPARGGLALEVASGTGQHAAHFAAVLPAWQWLPSDPDPTSAASVAAWAADAPAGRVQPLLPLDVMQPPPWPGVPAVLDAVYCANMIHIAPWPACLALMQGAARHLADDGVLVLYGPFVVAGRPTAESNLAFDADLRQRDARWGLRALADVDTAAAACGLQRFALVDMPANNLCVAWRRATPGQPAHGTV